MKLLEYPDGSIELIEGPCAIAALRPRFLHLKLRERLAAETQLWPVDAAAIADIVDRHKFYIARLAEHLRPAPVLDDMSPEQIYEWFIATEPEEIGGQLVLGLSHIETLMGISRRTQGEAEEGSELVEEEPIEGTGDPLLDMVVDAHLIFKRHAQRMLNTYSVPDLYSMMCYASRRHKEAMEQAKRSAGNTPEKVSSTAIKSVDGSRDVTIPPAVAGKLAKIGIDMPD